MNLATRSDLAAVLKKAAAGLRKLAARKGPVINLGKLKALKNGRS